MGIKTLHDQWVDTTSQNSYLQTIQLQDLNDQLEDGSYNLRCEVVNAVGQKILKNKYPLSC